MSRAIGPESARELLDRADDMIAEGAIQAEICRQLGISHVVYQRLRRVYGGVEPSSRHASWRSGFGED